MKDNGWRLLVDRLAGGARCELEPLAVPRGISYLTATSGGERLSIASRPPRRGDPLLVLEGIEFRGRPRLLALCPSEDAVRLNGAPAPALAALDVKDELQLDARTVLHVTRYRKPYVGPPPEGLVGKDCPVCRTPIESDTTVCLCVNCAAGLHLEGEERGDDRLECARLESCPACGETLRLDEGYAFVPED